MFVPGLGTPSGVESFDESIDRRFGSGLGPVGSLVARGWGSSGKPPNPLGELIQSERVIVAERTLRGRRLVLNPNSED